ncbi:MAG: hypothetical protein ABMA64_28910 [Myxococcota bacterium]
MSSLLLLALEAARACSCASLCAPWSALEIREQRNASVRSATDLVVGVVEDWTVTDDCDDFGLRCLPPAPYRITVKLAVSAHCEPTVRELTWVGRRQTCDCSCPPPHVAWAKGERTLFWQLPSGAWDWHPIPTNRACVALASHPRPSAAVRCLDATRPAAKW